VVPLREERIGNGIFCLEGDWFKRPGRQTSVRPILDLVQDWDPDYKVPYVHKTVEVREALSLYLGWWTQARYADYPILYLAFHGDQGKLYLSRRSGGEGRKTYNDLLSLGEIGEMLGRRCHGRMIFLAGCKTLSIEGWRLKDLCRKTGAVAILGYRADVDWLPATSFEAIVLWELARSQMDGRGLRGAMSRIESSTVGLASRLRFTVYGATGRL
jgi:hypothetical protein